MLVQKKKLNNLLLFSLFLDCPYSSPQISCFCCAWKGLWCQFSCLSPLSWAGFVLFFIFPGAEQPLPFTSSIFTPLFFPATTSQLPTHEEIQAPRAFRTPHKHRISAYPSPLTTGFYSVFFSSSEAGLYVHIFDLRGIIAATRVNNAVVNYKSEYLKMKPALSHSLLPNGNASDL